MNALFLSSGSLINYLASPIQNIDVTESNTAKLKSRKKENQDKITGKR